MPIAVDVLIPPGEEITDENDTQSSAPIRPIIGIIYPPPEVRNIVDKTASFVARNGPEFEARVRQTEINNPKFNFLNTADPYYSYYQHKVKEFQEGRGTEPLQSLILPLSHSKPQITQLRQQDFFKQIEQPIILKDPPADFEFVSDPPSISAYDLDVVKLTAQFISRNGSQFLTNLMNRENRNYQFDFLRPQHSLFPYFKKLVEQYTKVLIPSKDLIKRLRDESVDMTSVLENVRYRAEWIKQEEIQKKKEAEEAEKERVAYAQIDWHDFVVVETVEYQANEIGNFPPPTNPDEVGARVLLQERIAEGSINIITTKSTEIEAAMEEKDDFIGHTKDDTQVQDMEEESSEEEDDEPTSKSQMQINLAPVVQDPNDQLPPGDDKQPAQQMISPEKLLIKKNYDPKSTIRSNRGPAPDEYLISPITGERIPASKVHEHMRIGLLDPRWVEQRDRQMQEKINQDSVFAPGSAIEANLKLLAERRTDIFGAEETSIGKKIGEEDTKKEEKVTWDGHTSSVEAATRAARANITLEDQIHQIHKVKGLLPDEEKEKIGPKPNINTPKSSNLHNKVTPVPPPAVKVNIPSHIQHKPNVPMGAPPGVPPPVQQLGPPPVHAMVQSATIMAPQPGMMMMPPHLRPPPMMTFSVAPGPNFMTAGPPPVPQPPQHQGQNMLPTGRVDLSEEEPPMKRMRSEETLMPEMEFLLKQPPLVSFKVQAPTSAEKAEWKLNGQILLLTMPLSESVGSIKAKIHEQTGMPPGKQKLQWEGLFFKDSNSLAYYNITPGSLIILQVKERGGRKK